MKSYLFLLALLTVGWLGCGEDDQILPGSSGVLVPVPELPCDVGELVPGWVPSQVSTGENAVFAIDAIDSTYGVAVGSGQSLWRTDDAGSSWRRQQVLPQDHHSTGTATLLRVSFPSRQVGYTLPTPPDAVPALWHTNDGGTTWHTYRYPDLLSLSAIKFFSPSVGLAIGQPNNVNGVRLLRSTDAGRNWSIVQDPVLRTVESRFLTGPDESVVVSGTDESNVPALFALHADGTYARWTRPTTNPLTFLHALPSGVLRARFDIPNGFSATIGTGITFTSDDAGQSWEPFGSAALNGTATAGHWRTATEGFYFAQTRNYQGTLGDTEAAVRAPYQVYRSDDGNDVLTATAHPGSCALEGPSASFGHNVFVQARKTTFLRLERE